MRRTVAILSIIVILASALPPSVAAATDQGLEWGVETLDSFIYTATIQDVLGIMGVDGTEKLNITVGSLDPIPDGATTYTDIPQVMVVSSYLNGSPDMYFGGVMGYYTLGIVFPVGNWSLLTNLFGQLDTAYGEPANLSFYENWLHWGYTMNFTADVPSPSFRGDFWVTVRHLKTDGVLASVDFAMYNESSVDHDLVMQYYSFRDGDLPEVSHPQDIAYDEGATGYDVSWNATDQNPAGYLVEIDGEEVVRGLWNSTTDVVTISVDGLAVGEHECTAYFIEASGLNSTDTVIVSVAGESTTTPASPTTTTTPTPGPPIFPDVMTLIALVGGIVLILLIVVIVFRRK